MTCNGCQHAVEADQPALIAAGRGDVPVVDLRFRCGACGSRNTGVIVSGSRTGRQLLRARLVSNTASDPIHDRLIVGPRLRPPDQPI